MQSTLWISRKLIGSSALVLFALCAVSVGPARAQTTDARQQDIQQLKDKLQQLDQMMEELKGQIQSIESGQKAAATSPVQANAVTPAAQERQEEPAEVSQDTEQVHTESVVARQEGERSTMRIYGFAQTDSGYNFGQINPNWFDTMRPTQLNSYKNQFAPSGTWWYSVRQTRFGVRTSTPTHLGDLKTIFEFEMFGTGVDAGQTTIRLRHAWGEMGKFGAGQTWSVFMDPDVFPNELEYWGPNGMVFFRNVQFRWMPITRGDSHLWIAAERPGASADGGVYASRIDLANVQPQFTMPDFSVQAHLARTWGYLQVAGMFRRIAWEQTTPTPPVNLSDSVLGWGVNVSSNLKLTKQDVLKVQVVYGKGVENYMNDAPVDVGVKSNPSNPVRPIVGVPLPVLGTVSFIDHTWSEKFQSTIGYSFENIDNSSAQLSSDFHQGDYALTNLTYYPTKSVMVGGEFQYGRRVNFRDGFNVNDYKLQFSAKFNYSRLFGSGPVF
jgi:hypothetical protein